MVVLVVFLIVRKLARHTRGPDHCKLTFHIIIEEFRRPGVDGGRVHPCGNKPLGCPVNKILRGTVAKTLVSPPTASPDEMKSSIRPFYYRGVTHHFLLSYCRTEEHTLDGVPLETVVTVDESQPLRRWFVERGGYVDVLRLNDGRAPKENVCKCNFLAHEVSLFITKTQETVICNHLIMYTKGIDCSRSFLFKKMSSYHHFF